MAEFLTFKGSSPWPWPWIGSYCLPSCITHRPLPTNQISLKSKKLFVDGRTYGRTFETHFIRSTLRSRPKNEMDDFDAPASVDVFTTLTSCCDLDLWPPESNHDNSRGYWIFPVSFIEIAQAVHEISWQQDLPGGKDGKPENITPSLILLAGKGIKTHHMTHLV